MRILSIGNFGHGWDGSICDELHIAIALKKLGHEVTQVQREDAGNTIYSLGTPYDFILIAQWDGYQDSLIEVLKEFYKCPVIYWAFDYQSSGQEWHYRLVSDADLYLSKRLADSKYDNWQWFSQDFAPGFLDKHPIEDVEQDIDVLFTGSYLPWADERNATLRAVDEKFNLVIHSVNEWPDFKDVRGPVMDDALPELYARAKVILSIDHTLEAGYWSDRNAQIMASGRRPLFRYVPLSESVFRNHVEYFYSIDDCLKQIQWQLDGKMDGLFHTMSYHYARANLMVINRVQDLVTIVRSIL